MLQEEIEKKAVLVKEVYKEREVKYELKEKIQQQKTKDYYDILAVLIFCINFYRKMQKKWKKFYTKRN